MQQAVAEAALALAMDEYIGSSDAKAVRSAGLERMNPADLPPCLPGLWTAAAADVVDAEHLAVARSPLLQNL